MEIISDRETVIRILAEAPLDNVVLLKHLAAYPQATTALAVSESGETAGLVIMESAASPFDRAAYPDAAIVAFIASPSARLTEALFRHVPLARGAVFKLQSDADRAVIAQMLPAECVRIYHSFTHSGGARRDPAVRISRNPRDADYALLAIQGHERGVLAPLLASGEAFVSVLDDPANGDLPVSICCAFRNHGPVFEIGGVVTREDQRGKGFAPRVVRTALAVLEEDGLLARYHVEAQNGASLRVATGLGLRRFLTLTHHRVAAGDRLHWGGAAGGRSLRRADGRRPG